MLFELQDNLGLIDARKCNTNFGASLPLNPKEIASGCTVDLPHAAANFLSGKYKSLLKPVKGKEPEPEVEPVKSAYSMPSRVKGEAKESELKAPLK